MNVTTLIIVGSTGSTATKKPISVIAKSKGKLWALRLCITSIPKQFLCKGNQLADIFDYSGLRLKLLASFYKVTPILDGKSYHAKDIPGLRLAPRFGRSFLLFLVYLLVYPQSYRREFGPRHSFSPPFTLLHRNSYRGFWRTQVELPARCK